MKSIFALVSLSLLFACSHGIQSSERTPGSSTLTDPNLPAIVLVSREQAEVHGKKWMITTDGKEASLAADRVLKDGGNLIDAAIAASLVTSVERPEATGIGGGGFLIYHEAKTGKNYAIDFRERAPSRATQKMFLNAKGEVIEDLSLTGALSVGVPGLIKGLSYIHKRWGTKKWHALFVDAERVARQGITVNPEIDYALDSEFKGLKKFKSTTKIFFNSNGTRKKLGDTVIQNDLAKTLHALSLNPESFYSGSIAEKIVKSTSLHGGILSLSDLKNYSVREHTAIDEEWNGYHVVTMPPPSSGGIHLVQLLKIMTAAAPGSKGFENTDTAHTFAAASQQVFADRAEYLEDPSFFNVPTNALLSSAHIQQMVQSINTKKATPAKEIKPGYIPPVEPTHTSHFSIMDSEGNAVVSTQTVNGYFGSKLIVEGTGFFLNNQMDDFVAKPGSSNLFQILGKEKNLIAPKKTPLSSMTPTLVLKKGQPVMAIGARGGTRIITTVAQTILNYFIYHQDLYSSLTLPRLHNQLFPDVFRIENLPYSPQTQDALKERGWKLIRNDIESYTNAIVFENHEFIGIADPRDVGSSKGE